MLRGVGRERRSGRLLKKLGWRDKLRSLDLLLWRGWRIEAVIRIVCVHPILYWSVLVPIPAFMDGRLILGRRAIWDERRTRLRDFIRVGRILPRPVSIPRRWPAIIRHVVNFTTSSGESSIQIDPHWERASVSRLHLKSELVLDTAIRPRRGITSVGIPTFRYFTTSHENSCVTIQPFVIVQLSLFNQNFPLLLEEQSICRR